MSGRTFSFEVNRTSGAPPATLFRLESDGARWSEWAKPLIASIIARATRRPVASEPSARSDCGRC